MNDSATAPEASEVMVGPAIRPPSPQVVPPTLAEDDEVEEIEREEPRAQSVRILRKHDDDIVIVEEEDTTKEFRRLETSLTGVMKQIKVSASVPLPKHRPSVDKGWVHRRTERCGDPAAGVKGP